MKNNPNLSSHTKKYDAHEMNLYDKSVKEKSIKVKEDIPKKPCDSTSCLLEAMANENIV